MEDARGTFFSDTHLPSDTSWWFDDALAQDAADGLCPPLAGQHSYDVAIVGGGYTGLWTALALKSRQPGLRVVLIEAGTCGCKASGKNGGVVHGYWGSLPGNAANLGADGALEVARMGTVAQDGIRAFATARGRDVWWREEGNLRVSAAPAQDASIAHAVQTAQYLGVPDTARALSPREVAALCGSPTFRAGLHMQEGANVHPARLVSALRKAVIEVGVVIHEHTAMQGFDKGHPIRIRTKGGEILARDLVLATNAALSDLPEARPHLSIFSSYAVMTQPADDALEQLRWRNDMAISDLRMFLHYFRKTADNRVLMGSGSGPISMFGNTQDQRLTGDTGSIDRAVRGLRRLLPTFRNISIASAWGGEIDVSADRLPIVKTIPGSRVHYACGFSGHGVNPTYMAGQILASLVLGEKNRWTSLPLHTRDVPRLPPEPFRTYGGRAIRWAILSCEESDEMGKRAGIVQRSLAALPRKLGMRVGTR